MTSMYLFILAALLAVSSGDFPFRNTSLSWGTRVSDLISRLTLEEVALQLAKGGGSGGPAPPIARLAIKPYNWNTECLRGLFQAGSATSFPQALGLSATFDSTMIGRVAHAIGLELRSKHNNYSRHGDYADHTGMSCFSPMVNIMRHPLWGRNQEVYGEDPYLSGEVAATYVRSVRGNHPRYFLASTVCKSFAAYAGPEDKPVQRFSFNAVVPPRDLQMTYFPQFRRCVEAGAMGVMCSYNKLNGIPSCANKWLLTDVVKKKWNFNGYIVSDAEALEFMVTRHKTYKTFLDAAVGAVNAGVNLELGSAKDPAYSHLVEAVRGGKITETRLRELAVPLFYTRFRLGEFDPVSMNPYTQLDVAKIVQSEEHREISLLAAIKSFVLLKNDNLLPLQSTSKKLAIVGPFATDMTNMYGDYSADRMPQYEIPLDKGLKELSHEISTGQICTDGPQCSHYNSSQLATALTGADLVVLTVGTGLTLECEGIDRWNMNLTAGQQRLLSDTIHSTSAPIILLIFAGSPVDIRAAVSSDKVRAIIWCGFPAQTAGQAVASVLMRPKKEGGDGSWAGISGRLPFTWYQTSAGLTNMTDYVMNNLTYRYFSGVPLFPFGYGLGYSKMKYDNLVIPTSVRQHEIIRLSVTVTNTGIYNSDEVVQVYISWPKQTKDVPQRQLVAFRRVTLTSKSRLSVNFTISPEQVEVWSSDRMIPFRGVILVSIGGQQPDQKTVLPSNILTGSVAIS